MPRQNALNTCHCVMEWVDLLGPKATSGELYLSYLALRLNPNHQWQSNWFKLIQPFLSFETSYTPYDIARSKVYVSQTLGHDRLHFKNCLCLQVNKDLRAQLAAMQKKLDAAAKESDASRSSVKTPSNPRRRAPSPVTASDASSDDDAWVESEYDDQGGSGSDQEPTEAAKNNRLRRLCEKKPSGRCHVPNDVHERWAKGGVERMKLRDELEHSGWNKDWFNLPLLFCFDTSIGYFCLAFPSKIISSMIGTEKNIL